MTDPSDRGMKYTITTRDRREWLIVEDDDLAVAAIKARAGSRVVDVEVRWSEDDPELQTLVEQAKAEAEEWLASRQPTP